jgi:RNA 2',3'-cyclic 3'-phosphodiesterase
MKRIFAAIKIVPSSELTSVMNILRNSLGASQVRWAESSGMHLTLAFLGETEEKMVLKASEIVRLCSSESSMFTILVSGLGVFKSISNPRVIWAGVKAPDELFRMQKKLTSEFISSGFKIDPGTYSPHITMGRIKYLDISSSLKAMIEETRNKDFMKVNVEEIILYESILKSSGPEYIPILRAPIGH